MALPSLPGAGNIERDNYEMCYNSYMECNVTGNLKIILKAVFSSVGFWSYSCAAVLVGCM